MSLTDQPVNPSTDGIRPRPDPRLEVRWAVILGGGAMVGLFVARTEGPASGVMAFMIAVGLLYAILRP
ncbi:hypothetical protein O7543_03925 [Solwaraspora sp. WMMA2080]|uniref:hypothetical protein n=1 Tax=unclassified Solwaraspora TaxID=2627926 RepID=UPI00248B87D0|nr:MULTISPECIES: hypothetical protein [unclassified Solwaraspora]WBB99812.1 hypothetical protein O7553_13445 [Solwaraspora sp. WMMA2059]WBC21640.1 hypothetical protein O7543_03925 [Solwaraspora sp. WMMA2080]